MRWVSECEERSVDLGPVAARDRLSLGDADVEHRDEEPVRRLHPGRRLHRTLRHDIAGLAARQCQSRSSGGGVASIVGADLRVGAQVHAGRADVVDDPGPGLRRHVRGGTRRARPHPPHHRAEQHERLEKSEDAEQAPAHRARGGGGPPAPSSTCPSPTARSGGPGTCGRRQDQGEGRAPPRAGSAGQAHPRAAWSGGAGAPSRAVPRTARRRACSGVPATIPGRPAALPASGCPTAAFPVLPGRRSLQDVLLPVRR